MKMNVKGALVATAIAGLFLAGSACAKKTSDSTDGGNGDGEMTSTGEMVKCMGVNECKGKGACAGEAHSCAGKNECKGKGWIKLSKSDCEDQGGTTM